MQEKRFFPDSKKRNGIKIWKIVNNFYFLKHSYPFKEGGGGGGDEKVCRVGGGGRAGDTEGENELGMKRSISVSFFVGEPFLLLVLIL